MSPKDIQEQVTDLVEWRDVPQHHLDEKNRGVAIEDVLLSHKAKEDRITRRRATVQNFMLYGGAIALILTLAHSAISFMGIF